MAFKKGKICFGLLLLFFITFGFSLSVYSDTSALSLNTTHALFNYVPSYGQDYRWTGSKSLAYEGICGSECYVNPIFSARYLSLNYQSISYEGNHASIHFETNLVYIIGNLGIASNPRWYPENINVASVYAGSTRLNIESQAISFATTPWGQYDAVHNRYQRSTLTVYGDVVVSGVPSGSGTIYLTLGSSEYAYFFAGDSSSDYLYVERNPSSLIFSNNLNDALLSQQIAQNEVLIQIQNDFYNANYDAVDNINNQSTSDIPNATNAQTTSLIGTITSFVSAISTVSTGSCELTLPFPNFVGGSQTVNPCTGKEKAPTIVAIGSSMFLIGIFIPFAFIVLKMIYNEIRSFTNG